MCTTIICSSDLNLQVMGDTPIEYHHGGLNIFVPHSLKAEAAAISANNMKSSKIENLSLPCWTCVNLLNPSVIQHRDYNWDGHFFSFFLVIYTDADSRIFTVKTEWNSISYSILILKVVHDWTSKFDSMNVIFKLEIPVVYYGKNRLK